MSLDENQTKLFKSLVLEFIEDEDKYLKTPYIGYDTAKLFNCEYDESDFLKYLQILIKDENNEDLKILIISIQKDDIMNNYLFCVDEQHSFHRLDMITELALNGSPFFYDGVLLMQKEFIDFYGECAATYG